MAPALLFDDGVPPLLQLEDDPDGGEDDQEAEGDHRSGDAVPSSRYQNLCLDVSFSCLCFMAFFSIHF